MIVGNGEYAVRTAKVARVAVRPDGRGGTEPEVIPLPNDITHSVDYCDTLEEAWKAKVAGLREIIDRGLEQIFVCRIQYHGKLI